MHLHQVYHIFDNTAFQNNRCTLSKCIIGSFNYPMKGQRVMQQRVNAVTIQLGSEIKTFNDVTILKGSEGLYIETVEKIGTDNDGNDLNQETLTMYPWEKVVSMSWTEKTLIEGVKQAVILEALQEIEGFLEDYEDEEDEDEDSSGDKRDDPSVNPYKE